MSPERDTLSGCSIRPMSVEDLDGVLRVERASFPNPWSREQFAHELVNPVSRAYTINVGRDGGEELAGYLIFWVVHGEAHRLDIAVDPVFRRTGVARTLLAASLDMMRANMVFEVFLEVRRSNAAARALYRGFGFKEVYERKGYYGDEDAVVMGFSF